MSSSIYVLLGVDENDYERISPFALGKCLEHFPVSGEHIDIEKAEIFGVYREREVLSYVLIMRVPTGRGYSYYMQYYTRNYLYYSGTQISGFYDNVESLFYLRFNVRLSKKGKLIFEKEKEMIKTTKAAR